MTVVLEFAGSTRQDATASIALSIRAVHKRVPRLERDLVERAQRGDRVAFDALVGRVGDRLFGLAHHVLRDAAAAEDASQQALVEIWRNLPRLGNADSFDAWSYRIVIRAALAESERHRRWILRPAGTAVDPVTERDHANSVADRDQLARGFERISPEHRAVLALKYFADRSDDQIAEILGVPVGTVRSRLYHAIRRLRAELDADTRPGESGRPA